jgi:hypothetical protein
MEIYTVGYYEVKKGKFIRLLPAGQLDQQYYACDVVPSQLHPSLDRGQLRFRCQRTRDARHSVELSEYYRVVYMVYSAPQRPHSIATANQTPKIWPKGLPLRA